MTNDHEQEAIQAAIIHYGLQEIGRVHPVIRALEVKLDERRDFTMKFAVLIAGRPALVLRDWDGAYKVLDDPDRTLTEREMEEQEAYYVFLAAAQYLEMQPARIGSIIVEMLLKEETPMRRSWSLTLNGERCIVDRHEEEGGVHYTIRTPQA